MVAEVHMAVEIIREGVPCREHVAVAVCRRRRRQPLVRNGRRRSGLGQVRMEGRLLIVRLATRTKAQHHERTPRSRLLVLPLLLHHLRVAGAAVAAGGIEPEHQPFRGGRRRLRHDVRERDGRRAASVLVRVGHLVQWWVVAVLLLQQLRRHALSVSTVRTSEV